MSAGKRAPIDYYSTNFSNPKVSNGKSINLKLGRRLPSGQMAKRQAESVLLADSNRRLNPKYSQMDSHYLDSCIEFNHHLCEFCRQSNCFIRRKTFPDSTIERLREENLSCNQILQWIEYCKADFKTDYRFDNLKEKAKEYRHYIKELQNEIDLFQSVLNPIKRQSITNSLSKQARFLFNKKENSDSKIRENFEAKFYRVIESLKFYENKLNLSDKDKIDIQNKIVLLKRDLIFYKDKLESTKFRIPILLSKENQAARENLASTQTNSNKRKQILFSVNLTEVYLSFVPKTYFTFPFTYHLIFQNVLWLLILADKIEKSKITFKTLDGKTKVYKSVKTAIQAIKKY